MVGPATKPNPLALESQEMSAALGNYRQAETRSGLARLESAEQLIFDGLQRLDQLTGKSRELPVIQSGGTVILTPTIKAQLAEPRPTEGWIVSFQWPNTDQIYREVYFPSESAAKGFLLRAQIHRELTLAVMGGGTKVSVPELLSQGAEGSVMHHGSKVILFSMNGRKRNVSGDYQALTVIHEDISRGLASLPEISPAPLRLETKGLVAELLFPTSGFGWQVTKDLRGLPAYENTSPHDDVPLVSKTIFRSELESKAYLVLHAVLGGARVPEGTFSQGNEPTLKLSDGSLFTVNRFELES